MEQQEYTKYFAVADVKNRKDALRGIFSRYIDRDVPAAEFVSFVREVSECMPEGVRRQALHDSLTCFHGRPITEQLVNETAWRLAGNVDVLRQNTVVTHDVAVQRGGWCAMQVKDVRPTILNAKSKTNRKRGSVLTLFVLSGHASGITLEKFMSLNYMNFFSKEIGFTPPFKSMPFRDERELFGLRFGGLMLPELARDGKPNYTEVYCGSSLLAWNKAIISKRCRVGFDCPLELPVDESPCFRCWKGISSCPAAIRLNDLELDDCEYCGTEALFDMDRVSHVHRMCVNCQRSFDITGFLPTPRKANNGSRLSLN